MTTPVSSDKAAHHSRSPAGVQILAASIPFELLGVERAGPRDPLDAGSFSRYYQCRSPETIATIPRPRGCHQLDRRVARGVAIVRNVIRRRDMSKPLDRSITLVGPLPLPWGGVSVHVLRLQSFLRQQGWRVETLAAGQRRPTVGEHRAWLGNSLTKHAAGMRSAAGRIAHVHNRVPVLTALLCFAARSRSLPVVLTLHGTPHHTFSRQPGADFWLRYAVRKSARVISVSGRVLEDLRRRMPAARFECIPAYLPPHESELAHLTAETAEWLASGEKVLPLITSAIYRPLPPTYRGEDIYGIAATADLAQSLVSEGTQCRVALLVGATDWTPQEQAFMDASCSRLRSTLGNRFRLCVGEYAPPIIARSQLFIRPTLADGDSVSIREALDLGVPVVASDVVDRPERVSVYRTPDPMDFVRAVSAVLREGRSEGTMSRNLSYLPPLLGLYESVLNEQTS